MQHLIRRWYDKVLILLLDLFDDYQKITNFIFIASFIYFIVFLILYFSNVWKIYEEKLNYLLKGSEDLVKVFP